MAIECPSVQCKPVHCSVRYSVFKNFKLKSENGRSVLGVVIQIEDYCTLGPRQVSSANLGKSSDDKAQEMTGKWLQRSMHTKGNVSSFFHEF